MKRITGVVLAALLGGATFACAPTVRTHGYAPDDALLAEIAVGRDSRATVAQKIGRPVTQSTFDEDAWYYVGSTVEHHMYHAPKVVERRVVAVRFDQNDVVEDVDTYGVEDGRIVDLTTQTTPTHGRELTVLQQVLGNIGRITGEDLEQAQ